MPSFLNWEAITSRAAHLVADTAASLGVCGQYDLAPGGHVVVLRPGVGVLAAQGEEERVAVAVGELGLSVGPLGGPGIVDGRQDVNCRPEGLVLNVDAQVM